MPRYNSRLGNRQKNALIDLVRDKFIFVPGKHATPRGSTSSNTNWNCIARKLNAIGPLTRKGQEWHKKWISLKYKVKDKLKIIQNHKKIALLRKDEVYDESMFLRTSDLTECDWKIIHLCNLVELHENSGDDNNCSDTSASVQIKSESPQPPISVSVIPDPWDDSEEIPKDTITLQIISDEPTINPIPNSTATTPDIKNIPPIYIGLPEAAPKSGQHKKQSEDSSIAENMQNLIRLQLNSNRLHHRSNLNQKRSIELQEQNNKNQISILNALNENSKLLKLTLLKMHQANN